MKATFNLPDILMAQFKKLAQARGLSMTELLESLVREAVDHRDTKKEAFKLKKVSFKGTGISPDFEDWSSVEDEIYKGRGT